jgi:hypothetical protein
MKCLCMSWKLLYEIPNPCFVLHFISLRFDLTYFCVCIYNNNNVYLISLGMKGGILGNGFYAVDCSAVS